MDELKRLRRENEILRQEREILKKATPRGKSMRFTFIDAAKAEFPIQHLCQVLEVSPSGSFAWRSRPACQRQRDDLVLLAHVPARLSRAERHLWQPTDDTRTPGSGPPNRAPSDGPTDAREWAQGLVETSLQTHH
jgi:hypothetical protein